jgi:hypothetical protein
MAVVLSLSACAPKAAYRAPSLKSGAPSAIVVLPFDNETTSFEADESLRSMVIRELEQRGYSLLPETEVDARLQGMGITDGGQLRSVAPEKLGEAFAAQGLVFGSVEAYDYQNLGFVRRKIVRVRLRLVDAATGDRLWEAVGTGQKSDVAFEKKKAGRRFIEGVVEQMTAKLFKVELRQQSERAVRRVLRSYPRR